MQVENVDSKNLEAVNVSGRTDCIKAAQSLSGVGYGMRSGHFVLRVVVGSAMAAYGHFRCRNVDLGMLRYICAFHGDTY